MVRDAGKPFGDYFRGKRVFVTGHTGFIGSWLCMWLGELGAEVWGFSLAPSRPSLFLEAGLEGRMHSTLGDVRDLASLRRGVSEARPQVIFHLAAQALVRDSYRDPVGTCSTNILGVVHILEVMRGLESAPQVCQIMTTDKCYENENPGRRYAEGDRLGGRDPYSASKAAAELMTSAYRHSFYGENSADDVCVPSICSVRAGNVIGGGDWGIDRIIPDAVRALRRGQKIGIRNPNAVRPWQHVLDALSGLLHLAQAQGQDHGVTGPWNFGPMRPGSVTVGELADMVVREWGDGSWGPVGSQTTLYEAGWLELDSGKARNRLGWSPVYSLEETVRETVGWYRRQHADTNFDAHAHSARQIDAYVQRARQGALSWAGGRGIAVVAGS